MREPRKDKERLAHIIAAIERIEHYIKDKTYDDLLSDDMMFYDPRKFLVLSGAISKVSHLPLLFFLYLLFDYRWFVTFDNYLRKEEQIIIKIEENRKFLLLFYFFLLPLLRFSAFSVG